MIGQAVAEDPVEQDPPVGKRQQEGGKVQGIQGQDDPEQSEQHRQQDSQAQSPQEGEKKDQKRQAQHPACLGKGGEKSGIAARAPADQVKGIADVARTEGRGRKRIHSRSAAAGISRGDANDSPPGR